LSAASDAALEHLAYLWGFTVRLEQQAADGSISLLAERRAERRKQGEA
jgi:spore cortex formation protein SpoVR/YcgB (stage V sporulation)